MSSVNSKSARPEGQEDPAKSSTASAVGDAVGKVAKITLVERGLTIARDNYSFLGTVKDDLQDTLEEVFEATVQSAEAANVHTTDIPAPPIFYTGHPWEFLKKDAKLRVPKTPQTVLFSQTSILVEGKGNGYCVPRYAPQDTYRDRLVIAIPRSKMTVFAPTNTYVSVIGLDETDVMAKVLKEYLDFLSSQGDASSDGILVTAIMPNAKAPVNDPNSNNPNCDVLAKKVQYAQDLEYYKNLVEKTIGHFYQLTF